MSDEGDDSPPRRPRRKIKKVVLASSSSGTDSDDSAPATSTRKKRPRVLSDVESESSDSSVAVGSRRRRALPSLRVSEGDSDTSGWATDHSDAGGQAQPAAASGNGEGAAKPPNATSGFASDSSEGNSDKCSICLMRFTDQQVGTPQTCEHVFCLDCITEWSRNVNTCPVDRITFDNIVVRACAGGRVLSTQPVQVVERAVSVEMLFEEQPTSCEICGRLDREESMLLCDGCDLGFHMECLTPPLSEVPRNQWLCPTCNERLYGLEVGQGSDVELFSDASETEENGGVRSAWRRLVERARREGQRRAGRPRREPAPSASAPGDLPSTSRGGASRPRARPRPRARKRRRARTLIIEYELEEDGKTPVTKRVRRKLKRRKTRRRAPRTAARRTQVRESVRAKLAAQRSERVAGALSAGPRALAGLVPSLHLFGSARDLDYFSDDEPGAGVGAGAGGGVALAARAPPSSAAIAAYRQARRKQVSLPSPLHATAAPDILSSILESQSLLHSRRSTMSVSRTGQLDIRLKPGSARDEPDGARQERVDVTSGAAATKQAPSYPGQARGGGWGGGYRYPPERAPAPGPDARSYDNGYGGAPSDRSDRHRASEGDAFHSYGERPPLRYDEPFHRERRRPPEQERRLPPPAWRPYQRHSFGGFENPLDMRTERPQEKPQPRYGPLPEPPAFPEPAEEDERSDSSLVIDTDKYDPTEPTDDDETTANNPATSLGPAREPSPAPPPPLAPPASLAAVESILAGLEPGAGGVSPAVLDSAVRHVLREHRALIDPPARDRGDSDHDSDGDCPNFSIYSATSVHIASSALDESAPPAPDPAPPAPPPLPPLPVFDDSALKRKADEYSERVSKRCPITTNTRNPIKIKLNTPSLIRRQVSLYDEEDDGQPEEGEAPNSAGEPPEEPPRELEPSVPEDAVHSDEEDEKKDDAENEKKDDAEDDKRDDAKDEKRDDAEDEKKDDVENEPTPEPELEDEPAPEPAPSEEPELEDLDKSRTPSLPDEEAPEETSSPARGEGSCSPRECRSPPTVSPPLGSPPREKMTESISETEDERSYTPCLDEHREDERGLEGLDTELISEDEGNGLFSEEEPRSPVAPAPSSELTSLPAPAPAPSLPPDTHKKKKKKDKENKSKDKKSKTKVVFKKAGKGKERKYRSRSRSPSRSPSGSESAAARHKREKRKDLERYDVRNVVSEKRRRVKDAFGRDVSPRGERSPSAPARSAGSPSPSPRRLRASPSPRRPHGSLSPRRVRGSLSPRRPRASPSPRRARLSPSPRRARLSPSPRRARPSPSPRRARISPSPRRARASPSPSPAVARRSPSPPRATRRRRRSSSRGRRDRLRRRSGSRARKRRRSGSAPAKPKAKKKKRARSERAASPARERASPKRKRARRRSGSRRSVEGAPPAWSPRPASPRTPPPQPAPVPIEARRLRKRRDRSKHRRNELTGPSKEVFTSGDNILVSVSFKEAEAESGLARRERRRERRRRRRAALPAGAAPPAKPVAIIDLARSPCRELTPSPERVIVLSDEEAPTAPAPAPPSAPAAAPPAGPQTPPPAATPADPTPDEGAGRGPNTPPEPPDSPDAYDPYEPTTSPAPEPPRDPPEPARSPHRPSMTLEAAQKTNMSADEVLDRRPLSPIEKVMALLQSTRDAPPDPPPEGGAGARADAAAAAEPPAQAPAAPRVLLPEPAAARQPQPKLFLAKPSPIKSDPIKPMQQATKISRLPLPAVRPGGESPYSPGSSDFGDLFEPPAPPHHAPTDFDTLFDKPQRRKRNKPNGKNTKKKGKTQVDVKMDDDSLKVLDELPSSAVEMQVKSKVSNFLKKLNRQERVVEEVKLVLKPHYNKKHVTKDEYKHILRRAVPKICHNKTGEINPTKIQALVEAYVKKFRKKHKLGLS